MFKAECATCHGPRATGGLGPNLTLGTFRVAVDDNAMFQVIANGIPGSRMPGALGRRSAEDVWQLVGYVRSLGPATRTIPHRASDADRDAVGEQTRTDPPRAGAPLGAAPDRNQIVRITTVEGAVHSGRRMDEDTFSVRVLDDRGALRSFERSAVRSIERVASSSTTDPDTPEPDGIVSRPATTK